MSAEVLLYFLRPNSTSIWLPDYVAAALGVKRGDQLTPAQFENPLVQSVIADRTEPQKKTADSPKS